jgi:sigma-B regulation protein RsbU (phosphoserine phosphatase)
VRLRPGFPPRRIEVFGGPPLCAVDDFEFQAERTRLEAGEAIVLFTDGVPEAMTRDKAMYGTKRVVQALTGLEGAAPSVVTEKLYADVLAFADGAEPSDDVCILVIRRT